MTRRVGGALSSRIARTWKTVEDKAIKDLVTHLPRTYYQRIRVPRLPGTTGCKTFWVYSTRLCLRHIGDVTVVLSKEGVTIGPKHTKILVTNLDEWIPRQVVMCVPKTVARGTNQSRAARRTSDWARHQVSTEEGRIEKLLWHCGPGVFVADPCLPSGDAPGNVVEHCATAACVSSTHYHESSGAQCEDAAVKSP